MGFVQGKGRRPLSARERKYCAEFVDVMTKKRRLENMAQSKSDTKKQERVLTSMCFIGGTIQRVKVQDVSAFFLVEVTDNPKITKWIPCSIYEADKLLERIAKYREGDYIAIRGYVRAWSQKKDDEWKNAVDVRVTEIRSEDPKHESSRNGDAPDGWSGDGSGDDIPF